MRGLSVIGIGDPDDPLNMLKPNADGSINVRIVGGFFANTTVDKSFTTDGSNHIVIAANEDRLGYLIENPVSATLNANGASIFVNIGAAGTAGGNSFEITPGGYFPPPWLPMTLEDIEVIGATGIKCPAKEFI